MRLDKVFAAFLLEVVDGVGKVGIEGAEVAVADSGQGISSQVCNGATEAGYVQTANSILRDRGAEGQHIGAGASHICQVAPVIFGSGTQRRCTRYGHNLIESHAHINGIALGVTAWVDADRTLGRGGAVNGLNVGLDVLDGPFVGTLFA